MVAHGTGNVNRKKKTPAGRGIDKRWKAGIMKIRGGAAGRREPLVLAEVTVSREARAVTSSYLSGEPEK